MTDLFPEFWAILMDKGYVGATRSLRAIIPKKKPVRGTLSCSEFIVNSNISSDRVIVENFFGRVTDKFRILGKKYTWDRENLSLVVDVCFSLTNYHI